MKNKIFVVICLVLAIGTNSCYNKQTASNKKELDTVWNEKVQDTFYGLTLGMPISVAQMTQMLGRHGFFLLQSCSTEELLHFKSSESQYFSFGGRTWEMLDIKRNGEVLTGVCFMNCSLDKAEALGDYNGIKGAVETKYSPTLKFPKDTTVYAQTSYFGKNKIVATVSCFRYETVSRKIMIGTTLTYWTVKNTKSVNEEL